MRLNAAVHGATVKNLGQGRRGAWCTAPPGGGGDDYDDDHDDDEEARQRYFCLSTLQKPWNWRSYVFVLQWLMVGMARE